MVAESREVRLEKALQVLHDAVDDLNGGEGTDEYLCLLCHVGDYNALVGILHTPECPLRISRKVLNGEDV